MGLLEDQYKSYSTLRHNWFRLVTVLPGKDSETIRTERKDIPLTETPGYKALSYTWGSLSVDLQRIECNGVDFVITKNLFDALLRFRDGSEPRTMWIDALCINQGSVTECTQQISIMVEIYSQAEEVLMWLGQHDEDPDLELMFRIADARRDYYIGQHLISKPVAGNQLLGLFHPEEYFHETISAVRQKFTRPGDINLSRHEVREVAKFREDAPVSCLRVTLAQQGDNGEDARDGSELLFLYPDFDHDHVEKVAREEFDSFEAFLLEVTKPAELELCDADIVRVLHAQGRLLSKAYWTRAWVVQEIIVSRKASVYCGRYRINFESLSSVFGLDKRTDIKNFTIDDLRQFDTEASVGIGLRLLKRDPTIDIGTVMRSSFSRLSYHRLKVREGSYPRMTLADLLICYGRQQALDPRDLVFSLLNTLRAFSSDEADTNWARSFVNYDLDKKTVFTAAATHIVYAYRQRSVNTKRLKYHILDFSEYMSHEAKDSPSWVPEWGIPWGREAAYFGGRDIGEIDTLIPYQASIVGDTLTISCHIVDSVSGVEVLNKYPVDYMLDEVDLYRRIQAECKGARYGDADGAFDAFWRTVIADNVLGAEITPDFLRDFGQAEQEAVSIWVAHCRQNFTTIAETWSDALFVRKYIRQHQMNDTNRQDEIASALWSEQQPAVHRDEGLLGPVSFQLLSQVGEPEWMAIGARLEFGNRRHFIETATGFFGLAPKSVQIGDVVVLVAGFHYPVYLRPQPEGHYLFVDRGWVCGLMYRSDKYYEDWDGQDVHEIRLR